MKVPSLSRLSLIIFGAAIVCLSGCYKMRGSSGGGQTLFDPPRAIKASDVALPAGYKIEPVATGLTFPTGVALDNDGKIYVVEAGYSYGEAWDTPRLLRVEPDGQLTTIAAGAKNGPWNGIAYHDGAFYIAEGGELEGGRILRVTPDGKITTLIGGLPSVGDHHTNGPAVGPDGLIYFGQGTATNSGVVGTDNADFGWLSRKPDFHDVPCKDITLTGKNFTSDNPITPDTGDSATTGAFSPFGTQTTQGQIIQGQIPCSGAVLRIPSEGGKPELVAWGFRNPFGLAFSPDGHLYVTENGYDDRGSRPVWGAADHLWGPITNGTWYGWPDFSGDEPLTKDDFKPPGKSPLTYLTANHPNKPPKPAAVLGVHSSSNGFDFSRSTEFGFVGQAFVAQFGDQAPGTGKVLSPVGFKVVRVDVTNGVIQDFAVNKGKTNGPASWLGGGGLERPVAVRFDPSGSALYVVDFGVMTMSGKTPAPQKQTGVLWRITREDIK
jgi:glucose/arabinose dehydrogenase